MASSFGHQLTCDPVWLPSKHDHRLWPKASGRCFRYRTPTAWPAFRTCRWLAPGSLKTVPRLDASRPKDARPAHAILKGASFLGNKMDFPGDVWLPLRLASRPRPFPRVARKRGTFLPLVLGGSGSFVCRVMRLSFSHEEWGTTRRTIAMTSVMEEHLSYFFFFFLPPFFLAPFFPADFFLPPPPAAFHKNPLNCSPEHGSARC